MTWTGHRFLAAVSLAGALTLGGCAYDDGYGYGGVSVGTGYYGGGGYYDDGYGGGYYGGGYQPGYYNGWYNDYYYPGSGYYVYDRGGNRHRWNDGQRRYWEGRHNDGRGRGGDNRPGDGRPGGWQSGQGNNPRPDGGNWSNRPQSPQGTDGDRGRRQWRGNDGGRPDTRPDTRYAPPPSPQADQRQPQVQQGRPDTRNWGRGAGPAQRQRGDGGQRGSGRSRERSQPN